MDSTSEYMLGEGILHAATAVAEGLVTWRQLRSLRFVRLVRGVYATPGLPVTHELRCQAVSLIVPPGALITGRSAATVRGLPLAATWDPVEVAVDEKGHFGPVRGVAVRRVLRGPGPMCPVGGLSLASVERMGFDLAIRRDRMEAVADLDAALHIGLIDRDSLLDYLDSTHERGVSWARAALAVADAGAESRQESRLRLVLVRAGLAPVTQHEIFDEEDFVARVDLAFPEEKVAVEYDGAWHSDPLQLSRDRTRVNRLQSAGWRIVFVTADRLRAAPEGVIAEVRGALLLARARHSRAYGPF
ncbi:endonuclease domain-containing protein [Allokutzneria oryzae]|uniref:Endonuclease domain-containing protein n=1 Tax=Allokutzneria oryzae TaxID=1378989 RepID=A0ABV5ZY81_9PSEU